MVEEAIKNPIELVTLEFLIANQEPTTTLKNIPLSNLPNFYGVIMKDPNTFLFKFNILCRSYDYTIDVHRLKLFLVTLKDARL